MNSALLLSKIPPNHGASVRLRPPVRRLQGTVAHGLADYSVPEGFADCVCCSAEQRSNSALASGTIASCR
jgi:hypothetical protein